MMWCLVTGATWCHRCAVIEIRTAQCSYIFTVQNLLQSQNNIILMLTLNYVVFMADVETRQSFRELYLTVVSPQEPYFFNL